MAIYKTLVHKISILPDKKTKQKDYQAKGKLPIIDQGKNLIGGYSDALQNRLDCNLPVIVFGDHSRTVKYITFPFGAGADGIKVLEPAEFVLPKYLFYGTQYLVLRLKDRGYARHYQFIEKMDLPLIPIPGQEHIVSRIDELFSQLDASVNELKTANERLKVYRQAVLKEAFDGISKKVTIRAVSEFVTSGSRGWAKYYADEGARFIRITDLTRDRIQLKNNDIQYVKLPDIAEGKRSRLKKGDVLVSITADLGSIGFISDEIEEAYINQHIALIRFGNAMLGEYMAWYLKSDFGQKDLLKNKRGGGKLGLGLDDIRETPVPIVDDITALNTVKQINQKLSICDYIEQTVDTTLQQAEALRQSVLKKAFEGRLI